VSENGSVQSRIDADGMRLRRSTTSDKTVGLLTHELGAPRDLATFGSSSRWAEERTGSLFLCRRRWKDTADSASGQSAAARLIDGALRGRSRDRCLMSCTDVCMSIRCLHRLRTASASSSLVSESYDAATCTRPSLLQHFTSTWGRSISSAYKY
jgi:hypothetical protein